jgi:hypothetical protein
VGWTLRDLGRLLREEGRPHEAEDFFDRALAIFRATLGPDHPDLAEFLDDFELVQRDLGRAAVADSLHQWSDRVRPKAL